jgi:hypothetical protein
MMSQSLCLLEVAQKFEGTITVQDLTSILQAVKTMQDKTGCGVVSISFLDAGIRKIEVTIKQPQDISRPDPLNIESLVSLVDLHRANWQSYESIRA